MTSDELLKWCDDLHQVRGNVSQLQATLNQILAKAPTVAQYKRLQREYDGAGAAGGAPMGDRVRALLQLPQIKCAVRLKSLYDKGYLPFLLLLSRVNFKLPKADRFVGYLLDYTPPKRDRTFLEKTDRALLDKTDRPDGADDAAERALYPPTLPPLDRPQLLKLVLTDKLLRQPSDFLELEHSGGLHDFNNNHNRKLALQGRARLDLVLAEILDEAFPNAHEDDLEYLRSRLTATPVLAKLAFSYNFADAVLHQLSRDASTDDKLAVFRNVFLAYVGAMGRANYSLAELRMWVAKLYDPIISKLQDECTDKQRFRSPAAVAYAELQFLVTRVNSYFEQPTKKIRYEFELVEEEPYVYRLSVGDVRLGTGTGSGVMAAKQNAVYETFADRDLRTQLLTYIVDNYRVPEKTAAVEAKEEAKDETKDESADEAYSPGIDDYEPAVSQPAWPPSEPPVTAAPTATTATTPAAPAPTPTAPSATAPPAAPSAPSSAPTSSIPAAPAAALPSLPTGPAGQGPKNQARMPLPYGMLPPIPNMRKRRQN